MFTLAVLVGLLMATLFGLPSWPCRSRWSYFPSGAAGGLAVGMAVLIVSGWWPGL